MSRDSVLKDKSFGFAIRIVKLCKFLKKNHREEVLSLQILRSGTSVGANLREAEFAESRKDFRHKLQVSLKEMNETSYWLELLYGTEFLTKKMFDSMKRDGDEIIRMLVASLKTL